MSGRPHPDADPDADSVLLLLSTLSMGGSESKFVKLAGSLAARGTRVTLAYLNPPEDLLERIDPRVAVMPLQRRGKFSWRALRTLVDAIRRSRASTVVAVNLYASLYGALARLWLGRARFRYAVSVNTTDFVSDRQARQMRLFRHVLRRADLVIFGAENQRRIWRELYGLARPGLETAVLYNGVDTERFAPGAAQPDSSWRPQTRLVIGTVGGLRVEKAHGHLVRATAELRARGLDVGALIVGEGRERPRIEAEIARYELEDRVVLAGATHDVRPYLAHMDVFVLPSIGIETFSNAALEAMAMGLPVVSSRIGGMHELLARGGGVTYPPGDVARLVETLRELLEDDGRRQDMGRAARRAVLEHFPWERTVDAFSRLLISSDGSQLRPVGTCGA
jgi:glycosyltransferase involved in cell wall biosynthesis